MLNFLRKQMKWVMAVIVVAFLLSTFLMYEGRSTRRSPSVNADGTMSDYEVAKINGRSFMRSELEQRLRNYLSTLSTRSVTSLDMPALYQAVLNQAVLESQLVKEIDEQGIRVSDAEADQAMKVYADTYYPTRETFYQALANSGIKVEDYKRNLARQIAVDQLMTNAIGQIEISEDQALEFYDSMKTLFYTQPEGFMVHMADFNTSADAENFRAKLVAGESWDVMASRDSFDETVNITKSPVFLPASALRTGTLSALASLDIAEPSEVFTVSSSDYAVGLKASHVDQTTRDYAEVSGDIRSLLTQEEQRKRLSDYEESLRTKAQVVINDEELFARQEVPEQAEETSVPEIVIEEAKEDEEKASEESTEATPTNEATKTEAQESTPEVKESEATEETKEVEATETATQESKPEESKEPEPVAAETVEEIKEEPKPEETQQAEPEVKAEESESKEESPVVESEVKESEPATEEVKQEEETPAVESEPEPEAKEEIQTEESKVEQAETKVSEATEAVVEAVSDVKEEIREEVNNVVEAVTESLDSALPNLSDIK